MLVVDASVVAPIVADEGPDGQRLRARIAGESLAGPDLVKVETLLVIRRQLLVGKLTGAQADDAVDDLMALAIETYPTEPLLRRAWMLRANVTAYDACYVALAEALDCSLLTGDQRLARAPGVSCPVELA